MILTINMLLKKLIKNLPKEKKNIKIKGLALNNKEVKKVLISIGIKYLNSTIDLMFQNLVKKMLM